MAKKKSKKKKKKYDYLEGTPFTIVERAQRDGKPIILVGELVGTGQEDAVNDYCSKCGKAVESNKKQQKILSIARAMKVTARLLCWDCHGSWLEVNLVGFDT